MMRMIKVTRNISRVKITSDLQTKHEWASEKAIYPHDNTWPGQGQNENINKTYIWLYSNHTALNYT